MEQFFTKKGARMMTAAFLGLITLPIYALFVNKDYNYSWTIFAVLFFLVFWGMSQFNTFKIHSLEKKEVISIWHILVWVIEGGILLIIINVVVLSVISLVMNQVGLTTENLLVQDTSANLLLYSILGVVLDFLSSWTELMEGTSSYQRD